VPAKLAAPKLSPMNAASLVQRIRDDLASTEQRLRTHPYMQAVQDGRAGLAELRPFAAEQHVIIQSDLRSVALLASRTGLSFFLGVLDGERAALEAIVPLAEALGLDRTALDAYEPLPGAHAYAAYMAWLGAYASPAEVAAAYLVNFQAWGENCGRLASALRQRHGFPDRAVRFFDLFAEEDPQFEPGALALIQAGLDDGVPERAVARAARLLQGYEALFWDALQEQLAGR
jgi:pyrroloquinoline quinone (PQQ) biosynthesis protein C